MDKNETKTSLRDNDGPATVAGPASYEEELKDYSKTADDEAIDNLPDSNPEPSPEKNMSTNT